MTDRQTTPPLSVGRIRSADVFQGPLRAHSRRLDAAGYRRDVPAERPPASELLRFLRSVYPRSVPLSVARRAAWTNRQGAAIQLAELVADGLVAGEGSANARRWRARPPEA